MWFLKRCIKLLELKLFLQPYNLKGAAEKKGTQEVSGKVASKVMVI